MGNKMNWEECIIDAKNELGVGGWLNNDDWEDVVELASKMYNNKLNEMGV